MITEVYGGGGNSGATYNADFVELYNASNAPISLGGRSLQYRASGTTSVPTNIFALPSVTVPAQSHFLVQGAGGTTGVAIPKTPDAVMAINMSGTAGQIFLADSATGIQPVTNGSLDYSAGKVIDFFGYGSAAVSETAPKSGSITASQSYKRSSPPVDSDNNNNDFTISPVAPGPENCACAVATAPDLVISEVFSHGTVGGPHGADFVELHNAGTTSADLAQVTVGIAGATSVPLSGSLAAGGRQVVDVDLADDAGSTSLVWENDGSIIDLVGWGTGAHEGAEAAPAGSATESAQRDEDDTDTDQNGADFRAATPTRGAAYVPPPAPLFTIAEIQGTGPASEMDGDRVRTRGVVTARYPNDTGNLAGFYLQTGGRDGVDYNTPGASDALFVFSGSKTPPAIGASVEVTGDVEERFTSTQVSAAAGEDVIEVLPTACPPWCPATRSPAPTAPCPAPTA